MFQFATWMISTFPCLSFLFRYHISLYYWFLTFQNQLFDLFATVTIFLSLLNMFILLQDKEAIAKTWTLFQVLIVNNEAPHINYRRRINVKLTLQGWGHISCPGLICPIMSFKIVSTKKSSWSECSATDVLIHCHWGVNCIMVLDNIKIRVFVN